MTTNPAHLHVHVTGRVQGVGFRFCTVRTARRLDLVGWVRNEADGAVTAVAEGPRADLEVFLAALQQGPPGSRVDGVTPGWSPPTHAFVSFEVRYF